VLFEIEFIRVVLQGLKPNDEFGGVSGPAEEAAEKVGF